MTKELQDLVWSILPKEFKEEVKKLYTEFYNEKPHSDCSYGYLGLLIKLFGLHNLTSDAEEEEILMVRRKIVMRNYMEKVAEKGHHQSSKHDRDMATGWCNALRFLFGSKCLPDQNSSNVEKLEKNDFNADNIINTDDIGVKARPCENPLAEKTSCKWLINGCFSNGCILKSGCYYEPQKPIENEQPIPQYHVGQRMYIKRINKIGTIDIVLGYNEEEDGIYYHLKVEPKGVATAREEYLVPYSESTNTTRNLSQDSANCDKEFDNILKTSLSQERRLNIAAMIEPALISNPDLWKRCGNFYAGPGKDTAHSFAEMALEYADALISKADKGKKK